MASSSASHVRSSLAHPCDAQFTLSHTPTHFSSHTIRTRAPDHSDDTTNRFIRSPLTFRPCIAQVGDSTDTVQSAPKSNSSAHHAHAAHGKRKGTSVHENLQSSELFNLYTMLNDVKVDLLWGRNSEEQPEEMAAAAAAAHAKVAPPALMQTPSAAAADSIDSSKSPATPAAAAAAAVATATVKGHVRRPSTVSVASSNSTNTLSSDSDSDISNENDSGIESESTRATGSAGSSSGSASDVDKSSELARQYRQHLLGLYRCLEQMTEAANYLTNRYQSDVGPA